MKKFELLKTNYINLYDHKLYQIRALIDFADVSAGDLGGYVEKEENLSQKDNAWIYDNACVYGNAYVYDDAQVFGNAQVCGSAQVYGNAQVFDDARVFDNAIIYDNATIYNAAWVYDEAKVHGNVLVCGNAEICGDAVIAKEDDYIVFKNSWSPGSYFTYTKSNQMWKMDNFFGTGEDLVKEGYKAGEKSGKTYELYVNLVKELERINT